MERQERTKNYVWGVFSIDIEPHLKSKEDMTLGSRKKWQWWEQISGHRKSLRRSWKDEQAVKKVLLMMHWRNRRWKRKTGSVLSSHFASFWVWSVLQSDWGIDENNRKEELCFGWEQHTTDICKNIFLRRWTGLRTSLKKKRNALFTCLTAYGLWVLRSESVST